SSAVGDNLTGIQQVFFAAKHDRIRLASPPVDTARRTCEEVCRWPDGLPANEKTRQGATRSASWRVASFAPALGGDASCGVVLFGQFEELRLDRLPVGLRPVACDLAKDLVAELALVPALRPAEPVEEAVEFRFSFTRAGSIPATLRSYLLLVIPIRAARSVQGELDQPEAHHQVAQHLGLIER